MADFSEIKQEIDDKIVPFNNAQLITGKKLNDTLKDIVDAVDVAKVDKVSGKGLSSNDFTNTLKEKVEASISDAPSDGNQYARKNGSWAVVQGGGGSVDIIDNLTSERADAALSAKQGKVLKGLVDGAALGVVSLDGRMTSAEGNIDLLEAAVADKADKVLEVSTIPVGGLLPNTLYNVGELASDTTINLASGTAGELNLYHLKFSTGATAPTITWDASVTAWQGGSAPTINANKTYEVSILDGIGVAMEV